MKRRLRLRRVLCPIDLSSLSTNSLAWANVLARARSSELRALHVVVTTSLASADTPACPEREDAMKRLREALTTVDPDNRHVGAAVRYGDPGSQIVQFAKSLPADLIVMGAAGHRPTRPIGSVTATVIPRASCPVLVVPTELNVERTNAGVFSRVLCAIDLAPTSTNVIRHAVSLAWETHGTLTLVCVMTKPSPPSADIEEQLATAIPAEARDWCDVQLVIRNGVPAAEIAKIAESSSADVLVIGPPREWISTTQTVLGTSLCPVLIAHEERPFPWTTH